MSGRPIELNIMPTADTGEVEDLARSLDDVSEAAGKVERAIDDIDTRPIEEIGRETDRAADQVEDDAQRMQRSVERALDDIDANARRTGDTIGDNTSDGFDRASEGAAEMRDEVNSTAKESAASIRDVEGALDAVQEIAANAFVGFGPAGAAAGLAAAVGIGVLLGHLESVAERVNEAKEAAGELAIEFKDAGGRLDEIDMVGKFDEWLVAIEDTKEAWEFWQKDAVSNLDNLNVALENTGVSLGDLYNAFADGDTSTLQEYVDKLKEVNRELVPDGHVANTEAQNEEFQARKNTIAGLEDEIKIRKDAEQMAYDMRAAEEGVTVETLKQRDAMDQRNSAMEEWTDLNRGVIDSELDWLDTLDQTTTKLQENTADGLNKNTAAGRENIRALNDLASGALDYADSIVEAGGSQARANEVISAGRTKLIEQRMAFGETEAQANAYADSLGLIPKEVKTDAKANTKTAEQQLQDVARAREATVNVKPQVGDIQAAVNAAAKNVVGYYVMKPEFQAQAASPLSPQNMFRRPG